MTMYVNGNRLRLAIAVLPSVSAVVRAGMVGQCHHRCVRPLHLDQRLIYHSIAHQTNIKQTSNKHQTNIKQIDTPALLIARAAPRVILARVVLMPPLGAKSCSPSGSQTSSLSDARFSIGV
jgi:hypothetical protein